MPGAPYAREPSACGATFPRLTSQHDKHSEICQAFLQLRGVKLTVPLSLVRYRLNDYSVPSRPAHGLLRRPHPRASPGHPDATSTVSRSNLLSFDDALNEKATQRCRQKTQKLAARPSTRLHPHHARTHDPLVIDREPAAKIVLMERLL